VDVCRHCGAVVEAGVNAACRDCRLSPDLGATPTLPPPPDGDGAAEDGAGEIDFDLADWPADERVLLAVTLNEREVPWRWEPGPLLVVREFDEAVVEELLDEEDEGETAWEDIEGEETDEEAQAAMGDLFDAGDRLLHNPTNVELVAEVDRLATLVDTSPPPFGIEAGTWEEIARLATAVAVAGDEQDEEGVAAAARTLRDYLREYV
jgi:hypothetical protein